MAKNGPAFSGQEYDIPGRRQRQVYFYRQVTRPELARRLTVIPSVSQLCPYRYCAGRDTFRYSRGFYRM
ncbi:hypothetical protein ED312_01330 [Sinomicrobium pectinilyticum]|uniref:Uncharacterized protein n=1 Tax=Sinomicrobium pectinilyticum TaxID=1084421 RepID=A0A3N0F567_SINP1|nr:hypothetical protein ED312_01330 [Sinomicrobium pectinilyticum]